MDGSNCYEAVQLFPHSAAKSSKSISICNIVIMCITSFFLRLKNAINPEIFSLDKNVNTRYLYTHNTHCVRYAAVRFWEIGKSSAVVSSVVGNYLNILACGGRSSLLLNKILALPSLAQ